MNAPCEGGAVCRGATPAISHALSTLPHDAYTNPEGYQVDVQTCSVIFSAAHLFFSHQVPSLTDNRPPLVIFTLDASDLSTLSDSYLITFEL